ncbi:hypothetical protein F5887DRAFT_1081087 [Amanita rubescens]|nr:hypothetical protein F5887DRAFT_1081087 [Amanita rubescens]
MASEALNTSGAIAVEAGSHAAEPGPSSDIATQSLSPAVDEAAPPSSQVAMPVANKGWKRKGHRQGTTTAGTTGQGARVKKRKATSPGEEPVTRELPPKKHKAASPGEEPVTAVQRDFIVAVTLIITLASAKSPGRQDNPRFVIDELIEPSLFKYFG